MLGLEPARYMTRNVGDDRQRQRYRRRTAACQSRRKSQTTTTGGNLRLQALLSRLWNRRINLLRG